MSKTIDRAAKMEEILPESKHWLTEDEVEDKYKDIELTAVGMKALRLTLGYLMGDIDIDNKKLVTFRMLITQFLPSAGTNVNVNVNIRPEEYIQKAMENNVGAFERLMAKAVAIDNELRHRPDVKMIEAEYKELNEKGYFNLDGDNRSDEV
jgi:hypothetical protein